MLYEKKIIDNGIGRMKMLAKAQVTKGKGLILHFNSLQLTDIVIQSWHCMAGIRQGMTDSTKTLKTYEDTHKTEKNIILPNPICRKWATIDGLMYMIKKLSLWKLKSDYSDSLAMFHNAQLYT